MTDPADLIRRLETPYPAGRWMSNGTTVDPACLEAADAIKELVARAEKAEADLAAALAALRPRPESDWHEDMGDVLWFHFPIQEPPWVGTPLTSTWIEDWYTHFLPLPEFNAIHAAIAAARAELAEVAEKARAREAIPPASALDSWQPSYNRPVEAKSCDTCRFTISICGYGAWIPGCGWLPRPTEDKSCMTCKGVGELPWAKHPCGEETYKCPECSGTGKKEKK